MSTNNTTTRFETEVTTGTNINQFDEFYKPVYKVGKHTVRLNGNWEVRPGTRKIDDSHAEEGVIEKDPYIYMEFYPVVDGKESKDARPFEYRLYPKYTQNVMGNIARQLGDSADGLGIDALLHLAQNCYINIWVVKGEGQKRDIYFYDREKWLEEKRERAKVGTSRVIK